MIEKINKEITLSLHWLLKNRTTRKKILLKKNKKKKVDKEKTEYQDK